MKIVAKKSASQRTKNRLREHPNLVWTGRTSNLVMGHPGKDMLGCVERGTDLNGNDYGCWIPADEVEIIN